MECVIAAGYQHRSILKVIMFIASDKVMLLTDTFEGCGTNLHDAAWRGAPAEAPL